jgi:hypothetical protein
MQLFLSVNGLKSLWIDRTDLATLSRAPRKKESGTVYNQICQGYQRENQTINQALRGKENNQTVGKDIQ